MSQLTTQQEFDAKYISSAQIVDELHVSRSAVLHARKRGMLPDAVVVNNGDIFIWDREKIKPYLDAWRLTLSVRRTGG
jgi:orotate phosphoribosyltransferase-like protein